MARILMEATAAGMKQSLGKNHFQASSHHFLPSVPTSTCVMLEYNIQSSARVNSKFVLISNNSRNCSSLRMCEMDKTSVPLADTTERPLSCVMCQRAATTGMLEHHWTRNTWTAEHNPTMQRWSTVPAWAGRLSKQMS